MASQLLHTVAPSGADFTSLAAAIDHIESSHHDLVGGDVYADVEISGDWTSAADTTAVVSHNLDTDATRFLNVYATGTGKHAGVWDNSKYRLEITGAPSIKSYNLCERFMWLQIAPQDGNFCFFIAGAPASNYVKHFAYNIVKGNNDTSRGAYHYHEGTSRAGDVYIYNNIFYDLTGYVPCSIYISDTGTVHFIHNTSHNVGSTTYGACRRGAGTLNVYNNLFDSCALDASGTITDEHNATTNDNTKGLDDASNTYSITAGKFTSGTDFHLLSDSGAIDKADSALAGGIFSDDIDGVARTGTWDCGADEYVSAGGSLTKDLSDNITLSEAIAKSFGLSKSDTITLSDAIANAFGTSKADTLTLSDAIAKSFGTAKADTLTLSDALAKSVGLNKTDTITLSDAIAKAVSVAKSDTITLSDMMNAIITLILALNDTVTLSDAITSKVLWMSRADTLTLSDVISKAMAFSKSDTITLSDIFLKSVGLNKSDTVTLSDAAVKSIGLSESDIMTLTDAITKALSIVPADSITLTDVFYQSMGGLSLSRTDTITLSDFVSMYLFALESGETAFARWFTDVARPREFTDTAPVKFYKDYADKKKAN